jgi:hypothetical protein
MVGFGLDLSALQKDAPEAFRILNSQTMGMSAEMKRASREGAESFRLIDEALGIHVSRPLTRILTQEFPALASALQSVMGLGVAGALTAIGFEAFEKVSKSIDKAQHAQEAFNDSTRKAKTTFDDIMASFAKAETLHSLTGLDKKLFEIDSSAVAETRAKIEQLTKALEENAKAAAEAGGWWTKFKAGVGDVASGLFSSPNSANAQKLDAQLGQFKQKLEDLARIDGLNQTHYSAAAISAEIDKAERKLQELQAQEGKTVITPSVGPGATPQARLMVSPEEVAAEQRYIEALRELSQVQAGGDISTGTAENEAKQAAALAAAQAAHAEMVKDFQQDSATWNSAANKLWEVAAMADKLGDNALVNMANRLKEFQKVYGSMSSVAPPPGAPQLSDQAELQKVADDPSESWKKAGEILNQIESPMQKYQTGLAVINELEKQGRLNTEQVAQATALLGEQMTKAQLHVQEMEKELEKLLSHSTSAADGVKAFFLQLQIESSQNGKMAFDLLNQGLKGFEDEITKAVFTGKAHWEDMFRSMAESAFKFMLNKDVANLFKMIGGTGVGKSLSGFFNPVSSDTHDTWQGPPQGPAPALPPTAPGSATGLGSLASGGGSQASFQTATTTFSTAVPIFQTATTAFGSGAPPFATAATAFGAAAPVFADAATTLLAAATKLALGGIGGSGGDIGDIGDLSDSGAGALPDIPGYAGGTDSAPGGFAWVGEQGPELLNLPGGTSVTPTAAVRSGGDSHYYDMRGAVVTEDLMRKADFARAMSAAKPGLIGEAVANFNEIQLRTAGRGR